MRQWTVDAFAAEPFVGNQACVLEPLAAWPSAAWMQALAAENNQAETAFVVKTADPSRHQLRWFTPMLEVPLCGHATLAAGHVLFSELGYSGEQLTFDTQSGPLTVRRRDPASAARYTMDFPADPPVRTEAPAGLSQALGTEPQEVWAGRYLLAILRSGAEVRGLTPDIAAIRMISGECTGGPGNLIVAGAAEPGSGYDVIDRFFAPGSGIAEDPATGSAHCSLAALYAEKLNRKTVKFFQAFPGRGAEIETTLIGERVVLAGAAVTVLESVLRFAPISP